MELPGRGCGVTVVVCFVAVAGVAVLVAADSHPERSLGRNSGIAESGNGSVVWNWLNGLNEVLKEKSTTWRRSVAAEDAGADGPKLEVNARVIAAVVLSAIGACICAAGGVGGGGLFIPIFNLLLLFDAKTSAALSNIMILGGSLAVLAWNIQQTHPLSPGKPLIDYDVALVLNPNMLLGISIGVFCNIIFPGWLLISMLTVILFYMTNRSVKSGVSRWRKESAAAVKARAKLAAASADVAENGANGLTEPLLTAQPRPSWSTQCPPQKLIKLALVWLLFFAVQILRGAYTLFPTRALLAGALGGMLGIGGGMIINPMLIEVGMHPQVTAATSSFMIFFASSMSVLQFWLLGRIPMDFALVFGALCFVFSCAGIGVLQAAIVKYGRPSVIVFLVSSVMGLSAVLMATFGGLDVWRRYEAGAYMGFHTPCGH